MLIELHQDLFAHRLFRLCIVETLLVLVNFKGSSEFGPWMRDLEDGQQMLLEGFDFDGG